MLSDIHGVLPALAAVLAEPEVAAADRIVLTGDITAGPQPAEVLDLLREQGPSRAPSLRDAPVLVLDEPTTGLDAMAARRVVKPLRCLMTGRTTIMITHDLNLAPDADRILVVDRGRIVETGRHEELLVRGGAYARLHRSQNNAVMDTGELRMPLWQEQQPPVPVYGQAPAYQQPYGHDPYAAPLPAGLPDGRPLFRDEEAWPGI